MMSAGLPITPGHVAQLKARALDPALAASLGVRSMVGREGKMVLAFDYRHRGKIHNTKMRYGKGDMPWTETGKPLILWGLDDLVPPPSESLSEAVIITEGEFDRIALLQVGFTRVVSVPNGATTRAGSGDDKQYQYIYQGRGEIHRDIAKFKTVIIATDGDRPGMALRDDLAVRIGDAKCLWVKWPEGCKDANEVLMKLGDDALIACVKAAKHMWIDIVSAMSDIPEQPPEEGLDIGFDVMKLPIEAGGIRMPRHGFVTIVGPAGSGKSVFARQVLWNLWRTYSLPFAITALEEPARPRYQRAFRRYATGLPYDDWTRDKIAEADEEIEYALRVIQRPKGDLMHASVLLNAIEFSIQVYGTKVICIDPVNEVEIDDEKRSDIASRTLIMSLKDLAERYRVLIIAITHPPVDVMRRKRPTDLWTLYDVENGRHWAGKSDAGFGIWRPHPRGPTLINVSKLKSHEIFGEPNLFMATYDRALDRHLVIRSGFDIIAQVQADDAAGIYDRPTNVTPMRPATRAEPVWSGNRGDED